MMGLRLCAKSYFAAALRYLETIGDKSSRFSKRMRNLVRSYGTVAELQESHMQPKLTPEEIQLLRQLNERDRQALGGMPRPRLSATISESIPTGTRLSRGPRRLTGP